MHLAIGDPLMIYNSRLAYTEKLCIAQKEIDQSFSGGIGDSQCRQLKEYFTRILVSANIFLLSIISWYIEVLLYIVSFAYHVITCYHEREAIFPDDICATLACGICWYRIIKPDNASKEIKYYEATRLNNGSKQQKRVSSLVALENESKLIMKWP